MGSRKINTRVNDLAERVIGDLKKLRDSSCDYLNQKVYYKTRGDWYVYGNYKLQKSTSGVEVYKLGESVGVFSNTRTATAWCILDANNKKEESRLLKHYDAREQFFTNNVFIEKRHFRSCKEQDRRDIISAKISNDLQKLNSSKKQLDKLINLAKYFQIRGFKHEAF